jgi:hypothetical protein
MRKIPNYEDKVLDKDEKRKKKKEAWLLAKGIIKTHKEVKNEDDTNIY